ncbi:FadR family transcriptional regulator [Embleya sp. NBC_00888]|uniref:FadR/GntR family transcriptional regulator n=1 Tax=Embleya sp. NBC_00888 TaxID=2975960 RepID=UPI00386E220C|nr:FadR family transcriptional regulator [Embleya sp. NBC_00888]
MSLQAAGRRSLVDDAIDQLRAQLTAGTWPIGARIPSESVIAERLRVGRNTVREAIRVLVHAGMLESRQGDGTYVRSTTDPGDLVRRIEHADLRDIFEMRRALDVEAARLAAQRRDAADLDRIRAALSRRGAADGSADTPEPHDFDRGDVAEGELDDLVEQDVAFHTAIAIASHNSAMVSTYRWFSDSLWRSIRTVVGDGTLPDASHALHVALADAIEAGDPDAAERAVRRILEPAVIALDALLHDPTRPDPTRPDRTEHHPTGRHPMEHDA